MIVEYYYIKFMGDKMKNKIFIVIGVLVLMCIVNSNVYANTKFNVERKSMKVYDKLDVSEIITTDSDNLNYSSSNKNIATIDENGIITTHSQGEFTITVSDENSTDSCKFSSGYFVGIDVSSWNNTVDWEKVKSQGIDFAMIRAAFGWYDEVADAQEEYDFQYDKQFLNNIKGAAENDVSFGIYHYAYATNVEEAKMEAEYVLNAINNYGAEYKDSMTLPIAYDIEDQVLMNLSKKEVTDIVIAFCTEIYNAGYTPIVYSNTNFLTNYLDLEKLNALAYNFWYSWYVENPNFSDKVTIASTNISPLIWQYTNSGFVDGATNDQNLTDLNIMYMKDRAKIEIVEDGQVIDTIGADKGETLDEKYNLFMAKKGYNFIGFEDENGVLVDNNYIFNNDCQLIPIYERIPITQIILDKQELTFTDLTTQSIQVQEILPQDAILNDGDLAFKSDNTSVATVDENGNVTSIYNGECNIICYLKSDESIYTTCKVSVSGIEYKKGDANHDGAVNSVDAAVVIDKYKNNEVISQEDMELIDMNDDGAVNSVDSAMIIDMYKNNI